MPLRDQNLRADDVDAGDHFGDGVLHLNARIDFDEVPLAGIDIDQKLDRAGVVVVGRASDSDGSIGELSANPGVKIDGRRHLDHLLMAALHGAVALVEVQDVPVLIAQDLHFDVLRAADEALEEDGVVAERRGRFLPRFRNRPRIRLRFRRRACRVRRRRRPP